MGASTRRVEVAGKGGKEKVAVERMYDGNVEMLLAGRFALHVCIFLCIFFLNTRKYAKPYPVMVTFYAT